MLTVNHVHAAIILLSLFAGAAARCEQAAAFVVTYYPQQAYLEERATFVLAGSKGQKLTVSLGAKVVRRAVFQQDRLEVNMEFDRGGRLTFQSGAQRQVFRLLTPDAKAELEVRDGVLYAGDLPAVLLAEHRAPPKHDRTWETFRLLHHFAGAETRPRADDLTLVGADFLDGGPGAGLPSAWSWHAVERRPYELLRVIAAHEQLADADVLLLAPSMRDLQHGCTPLAFRLRLAWLLQATANERRAGTLLVVPPRTAAMQREFPRLWHDLFLVAASHDVALIDPGLDASATGSVPAAAWFKQVTARLQKYVEVP